jgi:hypothetical protein
VQEFIATVGEVVIGMTVSVLKQMLIYMKTKTLLLFLLLETMEATVLRQFYLLVYQKML